MYSLIQTICQTLSGDPKSYFVNNDGVTEILSFKIPKCSLEQVGYVRGKYLPTFVRINSKEGWCDEWVFFGVRTFGEKMELWETLSDGLTRYTNTFNTAYLKTHCFFIIQRIKPGQEVGLAVTKIPGNGMRVEINRFGKNLPKLN